MKLKMNIHHLGTLVVIGLVAMAVVKGGECSQERSTVKNYRLNAESGDPEAQGSRSRHG